MIYFEIYEAQKGDNSCMLVLIEKFRPLIHKYSRKLSYEDAENDLICFFVEIIKKFPLYKFKEENEGGLVSYIIISLKNKYVFLLKELRKSNLIINFSNLSEEQLYAIECSTAICDSFSDLFFIMLKDILSENEHNIIKLVYQYGYTSAEIAKKDNISRQAVNQIKIKAINKIKKSLE